MLGGRGGGAESGSGEDYASSGGYQAGGQAKSSGPRETFSADLDDEIPF
jgi:single-strand DNA-binding protein